MTFTLLISPNFPNKSNRCSSEGTGVCVCGGGGGGGEVEKVVDGDKGKLVVNLAKESYKGTGWVELCKWRWWVGGWVVI